MEICFCTETCKSNCQEENNYEHNWHDYEEKCNFALLS